MNKAVTSTRKFILTDNWSPDSKNGLISNGPTFDFVGGGGSDLSFTVFQKVLEGWDQVVFGDLRSDGFLELDSKWKTGGRLLGKIYFYPKIRSKLRTMKWELETGRYSSSVNYTNRYHPLPTPVLWASVDKEQSISRRITIKDPSQVQKAKKCYPEN